ncbi:acetyltransferase [Marinospirillum insulare]|uniref:GDP-perosamine N-acetyltransferase n=1 Tax=Marinospirillum insulare TaxID=217169 RepID=A0ABQ6A2C1_9GAMM|nr:acetyltransferase [Marinospirillum insulare]GLR64383.1 GDP-perosamine N-acetyltransferase [Marinospirillum insulare]
MQKIIGIYGASGFGREILPLVREQYVNTELCFVDDGLVDSKLNGYPIYSYQDFLDLPQADKFIVFAIANSQIRESLEAKCKQDNIKNAPVQASNSIILDQVEIGEGSILCHFTQLTSNIKIGKQFHANIYSYVAHDCVIGDFVTFAPKVQCNGNVHIEDHAYIGTGAIIKQGTPDKPLTIGRGAIVGMGAVVTKSVPAGVTVIGNPARLLVRQ